MALIEVIPMSERRPRHAKYSYYVGVSSTYRRTTKKYQAVFLLTGAVMTDLRWAVGGKVKILLDTETNEVHLRLAHASATCVFTLSAYDQRAKDTTGNPIACSVKTTDPRLPHVSMTRLKKEDCYIAADSGDLVFVYPVPLNIAPPVDVVLPTRANRTATYSGAALRA